jgi:hypothetical protein
MNVNVTELSRFIVRAKRATYAGNGELSPSSRPGSKDLHYADGGFLYVDSYLGSRDFIGEEAVWHDGVALWGMNYVGNMLVPEIPDGLITFLKEALAAVEPDAPFRGPRQLSRDGFAYRCDWQGTLERFSGAEEINLDGRPVYELSFHGGVLS